MEDKKMKNIKKALAAILVLATILALSTAALASGKTLYATATVNLRKGAGLDYGVIRTLHKNDAATQLDSAKDGRGVIWYKVKLENGQTGWVSSKYISDKPVGKASITLTGKVNLRKDANKESKSLKTVPKGTVLTFTKTEKDGRGVVWYKVSYDGKTGWVSSKYAKINK